MRSTGPGTEMSTNGQMVFQGNERRSKFKMEWFLREHMMVVAEMDRVYVITTLAAACILSLSWYDISYAFPAFTQHTTLSAYGEGTEMNKTESLCLYGVCRTMGEMNR